MEKQDMADGSPECQIYLLLPATAGPGIVRDLSEAFGAADVACVALRCDETVPFDYDLARRLRDVCHGQNVAFLIEDNIDAALTLEADGVHLSGPWDEGLDNFRRARSALGEDRTVGGFAGLSRHDAMILGEAGAEYVAFGAEPGSNGDSARDVAALVGWWGELFQPPSVAWLPLPGADIGPVVDAGADFIALEQSVWRHKDGVPTAMKDVAALVGCP